MKTISNDSIKAIKENMKSIRDIMKSIEEDDKVMEEAGNSYTYDNAMARNRERFFDMMKEINEMAEYAASIYNLHTTGCAKWMSANAKYEVETI